MRDKKIDKDKETKLDKEPQGSRRPAERQRRDSERVTETESQADTQTDTGQAGDVTGMTKTLRDFREEEKTFVLTSLSNNSTC